MIDHIKVFGSITENQKDSLIEKLNRDGSYNLRANGDAELLCETGTYKQFRFVLQRGKEGTSYKLKADGSLKNYWNGENASPMTFSEVNQAIGRLAEFIGVPASDLQVVALEVSVPVQCKPIDRLIESYGRFEAVSMLVPKKKVGNHRQVYGHQAKGTEYGIKLYEKDKEQEISKDQPSSEPVQQVEFCVDRMRYLRGLMNRAGIRATSSLSNKVMLSDLIQKEVQLLLSKKLLEIPEKITLKDGLGQINYDDILLEPGMTTKRLLKLIAFADSSNFREGVERLEKKSAYYSLKNDSERLRDKLHPDGRAELSHFREALKQAVTQGQS